MKKFRFNIAMFMALCLFTTTFVGCAKDYDDDIKRVENSSSTQINELKKALNDQLTLVNGQINTLNTVTVPAAIAEAVRQAKEELTAIKGVLETRIGRIETDLRDAKTSYDSQLLALAEFKGATTATLSLYGEKMTAIETAANLLSEKVGGQAISINTLTLKADQLRLEYDILKTNYDAMIPTLATKDELTAKENILRGELQQQAIDLKTAYEAADVVLKAEAQLAAKTYTDGEFTALKEHVTDTYGPYIPEIINLLDKLGLKEDRSLGVVDILTNRVDDLETLDLDGRLSTLETDFAAHLDDYAALVGRVDALETTTAALTDEDIAIWAKINGDIQDKLDAYDAKFNKIGNKNTGLLGQLFTAKAKAARDIANLQERAVALEDELNKKVSSEDLATQLATINEAIAAHDTKATSEIATAIAQALVDARAKAVALDKQVKEYLIGEFSAADATLKTALEEAIDTAAENAQDALDKKVADLKLLIKHDRENIDTINTALGTLGTKVAALETKVAAILSRVQSISFLSDYGDAKLKVVVAAGVIPPKSKFSFLVSPASKAQEIVDGYTAGKISIDFLTNVTTTRAIDAGSQFSVSSVSVTDGTAGVVSVELTNPTFDPVKFYSVAMKIKDTDVVNGTEFLTQFIPVEVVYPFTASTAFDFKMTNVATQIAPNPELITTSTSKIYTNGESTASTLSMSEVNYLKALGNAFKFPTPKDISVAASEIGGVPVATFINTYGLDITKLTTTVSIEAQYKYVGSSDVLLDSNNTKVQLVDHTLSAINADYVFNDHSVFGSFVLKIESKYDGLVVNTRYAYFNLSQL